MSFVSNAPAAQPALAPALTARLGALGASLCSSHAVAAAAGSAHGSAPGSAPGPAPGSAVFLDFSLTSPSADSPAAAGGSAAVSPATPAKPADAALTARVRASHALLSACLGEAELVMVCRVEDELPRPRAERLAPAGEIAALPSLRRKAAR
jgi:hypothetical protein